MEKKRSIRVVISESTYRRLRKACFNHGDISNTIRALLLAYLKKVDELEAKGEARLIDPERPIESIIGDSMGERRRT